MTKQNRLNMRIDDYTESLLASLVDRTGEDKSKVIRAAIEHYALYLLSEKEVMDLKFILK